MRINFSTPEVEVHDTGSEWGNQDDTDPDCCDPSKDLHYGYSEDDEEDHSEHAISGERDVGEIAHDSEDIESNDGHDDESCTS